MISFFCLLGYFWEIYDGDLQKWEKTKKPIKIALPEGRFFSTVSILKCFLFFVYWGIFERFMMEI